MTMAIEIRALHRVEELRELIEIEKRVWGYPDGEEAVPLPMLAAGARRGAIILGAFDGCAMVAGCYCFPAVKAGRLIQWSHMLGVVESHRHHGIARLLKLEQRTRALAMRVDLIEWTFDPLQAANAYFNLARLGAVVEDYERNIYGESASPLWRGSESDRLIAQWNICDPHVARRVSRSGPLIRAADVVDAVRVLHLRSSAPLPEPGDPDLEQEARRLLVEIPTVFAPIQTQHPDLTRQWRAATRSVFANYLGRGYRAVDFWFDGPRGCGTYQLARRDVAVRRDAA